MSRGPHSISHPEALFSDVEDFDSDFDESKSSDDDYIIDDQEKSTHDRL